MQTSPTVNSYQRADREEGGVSQFVMGRSRLLTRCWHVSNASMYDYYEE